MTEATLDAQKAGYGPPCGGLFEKNNKVVV